MPKKLTNKQAKKKATDLFQEIIRSLGYCENCQKDSGVQFQGAHIVTRNRSWTRTDFQNAYCLCAGCHRHFHDYPRQFSHFITDSWAGKTYDEMEFRSLESHPNKFDWHKRLEELKDIQQQLDSGEITLKALRS